MLLEIQTVMFWECVYLTSVVLVGCVPKVHGPRPQETPGGLDEHGSPASFPSAHARGAQDIVVAYVNFVEFFEVLLKLHRKAFKFHNE